MCGKNTIFRLKPNTKSQPKICEKTTIVYFQSKIVRSPPYYEYLWSYALSLMIVYLQWNDRIVTKTKSGILYQIVYFRSKLSTLKIKYFSLEVRVLSAMIVYFTCDSLNLIQISLDGLNLGTTINEINSSSEQNLFLWAHFCSFWFF